MRRRWPPSTAKPRAPAIPGAGADYLVAVKANQSGLMGEIERFFEDPWTGDAATTSGPGKGHGLVEQRAVGVSIRVD
ncbi:hypothetical protein [Aestuariivirga sp.]|uniref:hypothetical protein n=1 Tax=Aestuariivirga sp. TaxID=2650926 RepID=UPI0025B9959F|nr:hypothetical protein [Aestuariivirga sp.]